jgi:hypothetical protein
MCAGPHGDLLDQGMVQILASLEVAWTARKKEPTLERPHGCHDCGKIRLCGR